MLNSIFYLSNNYSDFSYGSSENSDPNFYLSFIIDTSDEKAIEEAYYFFSNRISLDFSLSLIINEAIEEEFLYYLFAFFFIPGYLKINNKIIINFIGGNSNLFNDAKKQIIETVSNQNIQNVEVNILHSNDSKKLPASQYLSNYLFSNLDNFKLHYYNTLSTPKFYNNTFYLYHSAVHIQTLFSLIDTANKVIKTDNLPLYDAISKLQLLLIENSDLKLKNTSVLNELENYKSHIIMLKSLHEATQLQLFYDNEYEVLPLWYKRIGHALKVIMGKRSFRSLFNNNKKILN